MKGLILAGGRGTRLRPITHTGPKQLVPVANIPVLEYCLEDLREAGITEIGVVLGNLGREEIQSYLGDGSRFGVEITYIVQGNPLGLAHAVGCAREFVDGDSFVVYLGDNILDSGITDLVADFDDSNIQARIACQEVDRPEQFGVVEFDDHGHVQRLREKPNDPPSNLALVGIYTFTPEIFPFIEDLEPSARGELEITDAIQGLLDHGHPIDTHTVEGWWKDTGKPKDILEANRLVLEDIEHSRKGTIDDRADISGKIDLADSAEINGNAVVRGPVSIAKGTTIGDGVYVGPYSSIGPNCTLQNVHLENSVVIGDTTITANGKIVDSLIGQQATIESADGLRPDGRRLVIGEHSNLKL